MNNVKFGWWQTVYCVCVLWAAAAVAANGQGFTTLFGFDKTDGSEPVAPLVQATDGNFYGTTAYGGANPYYGTVFKITPSGALTTLYNFCSQSGCTDGAVPLAALIQATDGNFYGTTNGGGATLHGTIFKITPSGALTTLHSFGTNDNDNDGEDPTAVLIQATDGNFYGTTEFGGTQDVGTVFKITPSGTLNTLYNFCPQSGCADGSIPYGALIQATDGNFYGTTTSGGADDIGTIFKITPTGTLTTLHSFDGTDGFEPASALIQAPDGNFYGTVGLGGANFGGTIFKMSPDGTLTTLYSFCPQPQQDGCTGGSIPNGPLLLGPNGNFYGTTDWGGASSYGTIFKFTIKGATMMFRSFDGMDGARPRGGLIRGTDGNLYGTATHGGSGHFGTIFSVPADLQQ